MLMLGQGHRWDRWTDFIAVYLKTRVSAGRVYLWGSKQQFHNSIGQNLPELPKNWPE